MSVSKHHSRIFAIWRLAGLCLFLVPNGSLTVRAQTVPGTSPAQTSKRAPYTLKMLVEQANWDAMQRGPLLALDPVLVYRNADVPLPTPGPAGYELRLAAPGFDRMLVSVGTVSILAPTRMTLIEDKPRERPNLYDGLPRELKVKYLMSTLTPQQWKTLGEKGLGVSDLNGEQQPVYLSLLPNPFVLKRWPRDANGLLRDDPVSVTLTPEERAQVRLRVHRNAQVMAPMQNKPRTYMAAYPHHDAPGEPNGVKWERDTRADQVKTDLFGVNLSSIVPNKPKPSQLDYASARLNALVDLEGAATLGDLIARISAMTHLEIVADGRVARLPLLARGDRARAGDALKALALAVTGTFRKVGTAFVLTSDLTGIGTRQMRLAEWQWQIKEQTAQLEKDLTRQIVQHSGKDGGILALGYAPNDPYPLTPSIEKAARKDRVVSASDLTPALQQLLRDAVAEQAKSPNDDQLRDDSALIDIFWRFAFQLPNGALLPSDGYVGSDWDYHPLPESGRPDNGAEAAMALRPAVPHPLPAWAISRTLFLTPRSVQEAAEMSQTARKFGFTELVLQTEDQSVLKAAIAEAGKALVATGNAPQTLRVCAAIAPFAVPAGDSADADSLDVNSMNETAAQIVTARKSQPRWKRFLQRAVEHSGGAVASERITGPESALAPVGPNLDARFQKIAELARVKGLAGLFLYDTQPGGYAGKHPNYITTNDNVLSERENLGYAPVLRLAFLRQSGVDPLDLTPPNIEVDIDLLLPFFADRVAAYRSREAMQQSMTEFAPAKGEAWDAFRGETNRKAMFTLFGLLHAASPNLPLMVESRAALNNVADAARFLPAWASWSQAEKLFVGSAEWQDSSKRPHTAKGERYLFPVQFSTSEQLPARLLMRAEMEQLLPATTPSSEDTALAFDFRFLPASRALALLNEFILPAQAEPKK